MAFPIGVVDLAYASEPSVARRAELARADGFAHVDVVLEARAEVQALPVGCPIAFPRPEPEWCSTPAPPAGEGAWERTLRWWRAAPQALCEPWADASVGSLEQVRALAEAVPGVRFLIDTGHVAAWGGDIAELLPYAGHVQLRDGRAGEAQVAPGEGDVDFRAVLITLDAIGYDGLISIEYFDLPEHGWPCADPRACATALRDLVVGAVLMPEMLEAELARELIEAWALEREIATVHAPDAWFLKRGLTPEAVRVALPGHRITTARRRGKLLLLDTDEPGPTLALHLGMSGRILIDGEAAGDPLLYAANGDNPAWHRFGLTFADGGSLYLRDPRRLGAVELDPDEERLGIDAFALRLPLLRTLTRSSRAPIKAMLMDQSRIAGLGNLLTDEALFRAGIDPARPASSLNDDEVKALARAISTTLRTLQRRGGSHTGDHMPAREPGGHCPRDGAEMLRRTVGGRTTYSCPVHQR